MTMFSAKRDESRFGKSTENLIEPFRLELKMQISSSGKLNNIQKENRAPEIDTKLIHKSLIKKYLSETRGGKVSCKKIIYCINVIQYFLNSQFYWTQHQTLCSVVCTIKIRLI